MKLILASIAANIIEKTQDVFGKPFNQVNMAVIPTAANTYDPNNRPWFDNELEVFRNLGCTMKTVELENTTKVELERELADVDAIFVTGGNTYYLLYHALESGLVEIVRDLQDKDIVYIGSSAGSVLAGVNIDIARRFDDSSVVSLDDYTGLGLVDSVILPHADNEKYSKEREETINEWKSKGYDVVALGDTQALIVDGDRKEVI